MDLSLSNKTAFVCGASKGIGAAVAYELAQLDANIIGVARSEKDLDKVFSSLPGKGKKEWFVLDLLDQDAVMKVSRKVLDQYQRVHVLVNNSGGPAPGPITEADGEKFLLAMKGHLAPAAALTKQFLEGMRLSGYGRIINILSTSVKVPIPNLGVSNVLRAAMASWMKTLSLEVGGYGITANCVLPGFTDTERLKTLAEQMARDSQQTALSVREGWVKTIPARRIGTPTEIAAAVAFLASPAASYINGVCLTVDGGRTGCI